MPVRESKFRHLVGEPAAREQWYENLNTASIVSDSDMLRANAQFLAYVDSAGGGSALSVLPLSSVGKNHIPVTAAAYQLPLVRAHSGAIMDLDFNPFVGCQVATASADGSAKVFNFPAAGLTGDVSEPAAAFAHDGRVLAVRYHPAAADVLATATADAVRVWSSAAPDAPAFAVEGAHGGQITGLCWAYDGTVLASACKDKQLRLVDARGGAVVAAVEAHRGSRSMRVAWAGRGDRLVTTGFTPTADREVAIWDARSLDQGPVKRERVDTNTGVLMPHVDPDTGLLFLVGKGDSNIRCYELDDAAPHLHPVSNTMASGVCAGAAWLPKQALALMRNEVGRCLRLVDGAVHVASFTVPRRDRHFQADLYPDTLAPTAAVTGADWLAGADAEPVLEAISAPAEVAGGAADAPPPPPPAAGAAAEPEPATPEQAEAAARRARVASSFAKAQKFKHIYGREESRERTYFNLTPNLGTGDSPLLAANARFWAAPWQGAGGAVFVRRLEQLGKVEPGEPTLNGHRAQVTTLAFSPFDDFLLASGSDDQHIKLWRLPEEGVTRDMGADDAAGDLAGHEHVIKDIKFHPTASNVLGSVSQDMSLKVWDVAAQAEMCSLPGVFQDIPTGLEWNWTGSQVVTASKDRFVRVLDPRAGAGAVAAEWQPHLGTKGLAAVWVGRGERDVVLTVGFGRQSQREFCLWDVRGGVGGEPLSRTRIDSGSGAFFPLFDADTGVVYLCGKGDTSIRVHAVDLEPTSYNCADFQTGNLPLCGVALLPKSTCDVRNIEVAKLLRLTTTSVEPVTFTVPRADNIKSYFQDDIFCETRAATPTQDAGEWGAGGDADPIMVSLAPAGMTPLSEKPDDRPKVSSAARIRSRIDEQEAEDKKRDEAFSRMQALAIQRAQHHANLSGGSTGPVGFACDAKPVESDSDGGWSDDD